MSNREALIKAAHTSGFLIDELKAAHTKGNAVESLILLPMIGQAADLQTAINLLLHALAAKDNEKEAQP